MEFLNLASLLVSQNPYYSVKYSADEKVHNIHAAGVVLTYGSLKNSLMIYLRLIEIAQSKFHKELERLKEEKHQKENDYSGEELPVNSDQSQIHNPLGFADNKKV